MRRSRNRGILLIRNGGIFFIRNRGILLIISLFMAVSGVASDIKDRLVGKSVAQMCFSGRSYALSR